MSAVPDRSFVHRFLSNVKNSVVSSKPRPRRVLVGAFRGITLDISFKDQTQLYLGLYEREIAGYMSKLTSNISTAVDVGAADGWYSLYFLAKTPASTVLCFEPSSQCLEGLNRNLRLNGFEDTRRLTLIPKPVGNRTDSGFATLDAFVDVISLPCMVKIDVEGAELDVLSGARRLLEKGGVRWLIETHSRQLEEQCIAVLGDAGYRTRIIDNAWWRRFLPDYRPIEHNRWLAGFRPRAVK